VDMKEQSCAACHSVESWKLESFDHSRTEFPLLGKHKGVTCESCHKSAGVNAKLVVQYHGLKTNCESCHQDKHAGQFAELSTTSNTPRSNTTCESCHQAEGWKNLTFNHDKQSRFALTGGHSQVACHSCHKEEMIQSSSVLRFKPLSIDCESCHHQGKEKKLNNG
jgi:hypothetical protein